MIQSRYSMIQSDQEEVNLNRFDGTNDNMMRSYFGEEQWPIIVNNNNKWRNQNYQFIEQQQKDYQEYTPQLDEIIFIGEKQQLNGYFICQLQEQKLAPIHFKLEQQSQIFHLVWIKCLRQQLKSFYIGRKIAQFCGLYDLYLTDISNSGYKSYIQIQKYFPFILKSDRQKFCLPNTINENYQMKKKFIYFKIRKLESEKITVQQLLKKRIFYTGTKNFKIQNQYICYLHQEILKPRESQEIIQNEARDYLNLKSEYMNALLITANASFIKVLLVPNEQNEYQLNTDDDTFSTEFEKYNQILPIFKFINGNWQIEHDYLCRKLEKNQSENIKCGRIITLSDKGITDHELIFDWKSKQIQFNMI